MKIVAVLCVRNEAAYIANCLDFLIENQIHFAVIDNGSDDGTPDLVAAVRYKGWLERLTQLPFVGHFSLRSQLLAKQALMSELTADWFIHLDADEMIHPYTPGETLYDCIARIAQTGANAINADEFVFLPIRESYRPDQAGFQSMRDYYFFEPEPRRLMRIWRCDAHLSNVASGGHMLSGEGLRIANESVALRHYIFRDQPHAFEKYAFRTYDPAEIHIGWHVNRVARSATNFAFPDAALLQQLPHQDSRTLLKVTRRITHYWDWPR